MLRRAPQGTSLVAVNLTPSDVACDLAIAAAPGEALGARLRDHWNDEWVDAGGAGDALGLTFAAFQPRVIRLSGA